MSDISETARGSFRSLVECLRWGFTPSNFARSYRRAFGRMPKQVLDR